MDNRYLAIADFPMVPKTIGGVRQRQILRKMIREVWEESKTFDEFIRDSHISEGMAVKMDWEFQGLSPHRLG